MEQALAPRDAEVKAPDRVLDKISGEVREIDATIRYRVGSAEILIMIECRERSRPADVLWIEQLHTKQLAIGAQKCIAVSSRGFSKSATKKADHYGIDLRKLQAISNDDILSWAPLTTWWYNIDVKLISFILGDADGKRIDNDEEDKINSYLFKKNIQDKRYLKELSGDETITPWQYVSRIINLSYEGMREKGNSFPINKEIIISYCGDPEYIISVKNKKLRVMGVGVIGTFKYFSDYSINHIDSVGYDSLNSEIAQAHNFSITSGDQATKFTIFKSSDSPKTSVAWEPSNFSWGPLADLSEIQLINSARRALGLPPRSK